MWNPRDTKGPTKICFNLKSCEVGTVIVPNLEWGKLRNRELNCFASDVFLWRFLTHLPAVSYRALPDTYKVTVTVV